MEIWIVLAVYFVAMAAIGIYSSKKASSLTDFVVGGRSAGPWMSAFAYGTTYFSAVLFIGYAGTSGWKFSLWAVLIGIGNALIGTWLAWKVLAGRTRDVTRRLKIKTMPQFFEKRYQSKNMKVFAAVVIFIFMTPYSASVYSGLSYLCETLLHIDYQWAMLIIAVVSAVYLVLGGYLASLMADFVQGIVMLVGVCAMIFFIVRADQVGGLTDGISKLWGMMGDAGLTEPSVSVIVGVGSLFLLTSIGTWGMPQMVHKFYGIADEKGIKRGTVISTLFSVIVACGAYFVGSLSRLFFAEVPMVDGKVNFDVLIPNMLAQSLPIILLGVILVLVLSASVSTLSGITLTSCSTFSMDIIKSVFRPKMDGKRLLITTRVLCLLFIAVSFLLASFKTPILTLMSFSWGCVSGAFLAPYVLGLYWKRMNRTGAYCGMIGGLSICLVLAIASGFDAGQAPLFGVISMAGSFVLCIAGTFLGGKRAAAQPDYETAKEQFYDKAFTLQK